MRKMFFWILSFVSAAALADEAGPVGVAIFVEGSAIQTRASGAESQLKEGDSIFEGALIKTAPGAHVKFLMTDENTLDITGGSQIEIQKYALSNQSISENVFIKLMSGALRTLVNQRYDGEEKTFIIQTPASVTGVRGTDFLTEYSARENESHVVTFQGQVEMSHQLDSRGKLVSPVAINPGFRASARAGAAVSRPQLLGREELSKLNQKSSKSVSPEHTQRYRNELKKERRDGSPRVPSSDHRSDQPSVNRPSEDSSHGNQGRERRSESGPAGAPHERGGRGPRR